MSRPWSTLNKSRSESALPRKHGIRESSLILQEDSALPLGMIAHLPCSGF